MCRFLAYRGEPIFVSDLVCAPSHSLVHQSLHAVEAKTGTNGDGFGLGWYGERRNRLYPRKSVRPGPTRTCARCASRSARACSSPMCGPRPAPPRRGRTATLRARPAPLHAQRPGRRLRANQAPTRGDDPGRSLRGPRRHDGFEAIFLAALANGLAERPVEAMARTLKSVRALMEEAGVEEPLRFTASRTRTANRSMPTAGPATGGRRRSISANATGTCSSSPSPSTAARRTGGRYRRAAASLRAAAARLRSNASMRR